MSDLRIRTYPDEVLRKQNEFVTEIKKQEKNLFDDMIETMINARGLGLAAPQIGENCQIFVVQLEDQIYKIANPKIVEVFGRDVMEEGCLSVPDYSVDVERFYRVIFEGLDENGEKMRIDARGLLARIFQHELDHLNGKLILDYSSHIYIPGEEKG